MSTKFSMIGLLFAALLGSSTLSAGPKIQHWKTDKGTRVYFVEATGLPLVDIQLVFDAGSARDSEKFGLAAFTSSLLDKGAGEWNADQVAQRLEGVGAQLETGVSRDSAWLSLRTLTETPILESALETSAKVLSAPRFHGDDFAREQKRILAALKRHAESPAQIAAKLFFERIYQNHPYGHRVLGETETINALSVQDLKDFYREFYVASNAIAVVVGDVSRTKAAAIVEDLTANIEAGNPAANIPPVDYTRAGQRDTIAFPSAQTHIYSGMPVLEWHDPDYFALYVGNHVLGGAGLVSRISTEIREKRGLAYSASSSFSAMLRKGPFIMALQTRNDQSQEALRVLNQTLRKFISEGPSDEELEKAKKNLTGGFVLRIDSNRKLSDYLAMIAFYDLPLDYLDTFNAKVNAVTIDEIKAAFQRHLKQDSFETVLVGGEGKSLDN